MAAPEAWHAARTMRVLELLALAPMSAPQLANALHSNPRTVRRVLQRLEDEDYVRRTDDSRRRYEPTMRLPALAAEIVQNSTLARRARPYVALLHAQTGGTGHLVVPSSHAVLCLVHHASDAVAARPQLRELVPAHCTAGGKALLAEREAWRNRVLSASLTRHTERTTVDARQLRRELDAIRERGYAIEDGEFQAGVSAASALVRVGGSAVAALTVSGRGLDIDASAPRVVTLAEQLTDDLRETVPGTGDW
jgi:DNA-binding IclR family transcriptional regulator